MKINDIDNKQDYFIELLKTDYSEALLGFDSEHPIYRGVDETKFYINEYKVMQPNPYRSSKDGHNYYTLWINDNPQWAGYPNRAVICTSSETIAEHFGKAYYIFPKNGSKIGICPAGDIWRAFSSALHSLLNSLYEIFGKMDFDLYKTENDYNYFIDCMKQFDNLSYEKKENLIERVFSLKLNVKEDFLHNGMYYSMKKIINPKDFILTDIETYGKMSNIGEKELWFCSDYIMINQDYLDKVYKYLLPIKKDLPK